MATEHKLKPLMQKLGLKPGSRIFVLNAPRDYRIILGELPDKVVLVDELRGPFDLIHLFVQKRKELETDFPVLMRELSKTGGLWVSWPKRSSRIETDLNEHVVRDIGLINGLVDVKIVSIDKIWSGLKFVFRVKDRK
jgi:bifunctional DNA-binding transcriptional regulator/antitoxin component of YhaV-PrlF toxin-antitoxin module